MWFFRSRFFALFAVAIILSACQAIQTKSGASNRSEPEIRSSTYSGGKGVPNGRTDSALPYLRAVKLEVASDPEYGYSPERPIKTGPAASRLHLLYLNSLRGPKGEVVEYERKGSCCEFEDKSLPLGGGLLDVYKIKVDGSGEVVTLYVDMYRNRKEPLQLPVGFTVRER
jgi:hypothetical protein